MTFTCSWGWCEIPSFYLPRRRFLFLFLIQVISKGKNYICIVDIRTELLLQSLIHKSTIVIGKNSDRETNVFLLLENDSSTKMYQIS